MNINCLSRNAIELTDAATTGYLPQRGRTGGGEFDKVAETDSDCPHPTLPPWGEGAGKSGGGGCGARGHFGVKSLPFHSFLPVFLSLLLAACAATKQARDAQPAGFLKDYSQLKKGGEGEALLVYFNPAYAKNCRNYGQVMIEPVSLWTRGNQDLAKLDADDKQMLVNALHSALSKELGQHYKIVAQPAPGTLKVRAAITEAEGSNVVLDTVSSIHPGTLLVSKAKGLATGVDSFVGIAGAEGEVLDAATGERLFAAVDRRVGQKSLGAGTLNSWDDVEQSYAIWAKKTAARLKGCGAVPKVEE